MSHGVPLATDWRQSCGNPGAFFLDVGIFSTHHIARFWGLKDSTNEVCNVGVPARTTTEHRKFVVDGLTIEGSIASASALDPEKSKDDRLRTGYPVDPNAVIAAAFKAAGLAVPESPTVAPGSKLSIAPGSALLTKSCAFSLRISLPPCRANSVRSEFVESVRLEISSTRSRSHHGLAHQRALPRLASRRLRASTGHTRSEQSVSLFG
jgi:hypothetical protein